MNVRILRGLSTGYLLIPNIIFFYYWTRPLVAIIGIVLFLYVYLVQWSDRTFSTSDKSLSGKDLLYVGILSLILTLISGVNGICYQTFDYWCHNTKFYEMFREEWPLRIPADGPIVSYYYGYYVAPALYSKWVGALSEGFIFFWTYLGFFLGVAWLYLVLNRKVLYLILCLSIGDTPHIIKTITYKLGIRLYTYGDFGIESWSNFENLLWVPNQVIPTLIIGGMLIYLLRHKLPLENMVFVIVLTFWWAVFPALTSGLLVGILILRDWVLKKFQLDWPFVIKHAIVPALVCLPVLLIFESHNEVPISGFVWQFRDNTGSLIMEYLVNIGINIVLFLLAKQLLWKQGSKLPEFPFYLIMAFIFLFPFYRIGKVNDFLFRGLMPYLIIVGLYLFEPISHQSYKVVWQVARKSVFSLAVLLLLFSCSFIPIGRLVRAMRVNVVAASYFPDKVTHNPIPYDAYESIYDVLADKWTLMEAKQYLGKEGSIYEKYISKQR
ncbi:hypothetical protein [Telluribacter sp. SYSU D00476]|uniref:hypothetical protein n=1 Tax=Telluribacter sp. SYSU D00476 TaxID=2811430 RepID=UPI001FF284DE|nr:hypothetical protein [Telluribacter sp. SYSU D00476]